MITLISTVLVLVGTLNWFTIGALQYDFVAGLFGSQANIFSRIVYVLVGIAGAYICYSIIKNKGKLSFKNKFEKNLFNFNKKAHALEADKEYHRDNFESGNDNAINEEIQSKANRIDERNRLSNKPYSTEVASENNINTHEENK